VPIASNVPEALATFGYPPGFAGGAGGPGGPAAPGIGAGWEVHVVKAPAYNQTLAVLPWRMVTGLQFVKQMNDVGSGTVTLSQDDPFWSTNLTDGAAAHELLDNENLWQVWQDGVIRFEFLGETISEALVQEGESRIATVTGPGTLAALKWAAAMPPGFPSIINKLDAISDSFSEIDVNGNLVLDTGLWNASSGSGLALNPAGSCQVMGSSGGTILGTTAYDATNTLISAQMAPIVSPDANNVTLNGSQLTQFYIQSTANPAYYAMIALSGSTFYCQQGDPVTGTSTKVIATATAFNNMAAGNASYQFWQISEVGGVFFFYTSSDGQNWTLQWQIAHNWNATSVGFYVSAKYNVANAEFATVTSINSNVTTSSLSGSLYFSQPIMAIWLQQLQAAQARGTIPFLTTVMSIYTDSFGNPWSDSQSVQLQNGTDLLTLLQAHASMLNASYIMQPGFQLQVGIPEPGAVTLGADRSKTVIFHESADEQAKQRTRTRDSIANLIAVVNANGRTVTADNTSSVAQWGQREAWMQAAMQVSKQDIAVVATAAAEQTGSEVLSWTFQILPGVTGRRIFYDFNVADWIGLERPDFTAIDSVQVQAIGVSIDQDGGETHELTVISYLQFLQEQLQYIVTKMGGGFVSVAGTTAVANNGQRTSLQAPTVFNIPLSALAGVTSPPGTTSPLVYNPVTGLWVPAGTTDPVSSQPVGMTVAGSAGTVAIAPDASTVSVTNLATGAVTTHGIQADGTTTTVDAGGTAPGTPDAPTVVGTPGGLQVLWDGSIASAAPLSDFRYVEVHVSAASGFTPTPSTLQGTMRTAGVYSVGGLAVGTTYYAKLLARNTSGVGSTPSSQTSGVPSTITASMLGPMGVLNANPYFLGGDGSTWNGFNGTFSVTASPPAGSPYPYAGFFTITTPGVGAAAEESSGAGIFNVVAGQPYYVTAWVYTPTTSAVIGFDWQNSSHVYLSTSTQTIVVTANTWTSVTTVLTAPAGAAYAYARIAPADGASNVIYIQAVLVLPQVPGGLVQAGTITLTQLAAGIVYAGIVDATTVTGATLQNNTGSPKTSINPDGSITITNASAGVIFRIGPDGTVYWFNNAGQLLQEIEPGGTQLVYQSLTGPSLWDFESPVPVLLFAATSGASLTTYTNTVAAPVPAGAVVTVAASCNSATTFATGATDSQGNTYALVQTQASANPTQQVFQAVNIAHALTVTDTISVTYSATNVLAKCIVATGTTGVAAAPQDYTAQATGTSTAPSVSGTPTAWGDTILMIISNGGTTAPPSAVPDGWQLVGQASGTAQTTSIYCSTDLVSGAVAASATLPSSVAWTDVTIGYLAAPAQSFAAFTPAVTAATISPSTQWANQGNFSCKVTKVGTATSWGVTMPPMVVQAGSVLSVNLVIGTLNVALGAVEIGFTFWTGPNGTGTNLGNVFWSVGAIPISVFQALLLYSVAVPSTAVSATAYVMERQADTAGNWFLVDTIQVPGGLVYSNSPVATSDSVGNVVDQGINFIAQPSATNLFGVEDLWGNQLVSIDGSGNFQAQTVSANTDLQIAGQSLLNDILPNYSLGVVTRGWVATAGNWPATPIGNTETSLLELDFIIPAGRQYLIQLMQCTFVPQVAVGGQVVQRLKYTTDGTTPTTGSTQVAGHSPGVMFVNTGSSNVNYPSPYMEWMPPIPVADTTYRMLVTGQITGSGNTYQYATASEALELRVTDMGNNAPVNNGVTLGTGTGGGTGAQNYTEYFYGNSTWSYWEYGQRNHNGSIYQGAYQGEGYAQFAYIQWGFGSRGNALNTVLNYTVKSVTLRLLNQHTWYNSGMTVKFHSSDLLGSISHISAELQEWHINEGQKLTTALTSTAWTPFKAGGTTYAVLSGTQSLSDYGYFWGGGNNNSNVPMLTVNYTH
jgi:hypothetical protein